MSRDDAALWLRLLEHALQGDDRTPFIASILFLILTGAVPIDLEESVTIVPGDMAGWHPRWRSLVQSAVTTVRTTLRSFGETP